MQGPEKTVEEEEFGTSGDAYEADLASIYTPDLADPDEPDDAQADE